MSLTYPQTFKRIVCVYVCLKKRVVFVLNNTLKLYFLKTRSELGPVNVLEHDVAGCIDTVPDVSA